MSKRRAETETESAGMPTRGSEDSNLKVKLTSLNSQFSSWVKEQEEKALDKLWLDGVRDYVKYAEQMLEEYERLSEKASPAAKLPQRSVAAAPPTAPSSFQLPVAKPAEKPLAAFDKVSNPFLSPAPALFGFVEAPATAAQAPGASTTTTSSSSSAAATSTAAAPSPIFSTFGMSSSTSAFGLPAGSTQGTSTKKDAPAGAAAPAAPTAAGSFSSFGGTSGFTAPSFGSTVAGFSFGGIAPSAAAVPAADDSGENPEEPVDEFAEKGMGVQRNEDSTLLFDAKAKFYMNKENKGAASWVDCGMGSLSIRVAKTENAKPFICFTNTLGKSLLSSTVFKELRIIGSEKNVLFSAPWKPTPDSETTMGKFLFKLSPANCTAFANEVQKAKDSL